MNLPTTHNANAAAVLFTYLFGAMAKESRLNAHLPKPERTKASKVRRKMAKQSRRRNRK